MNLEHILRKPQNHMATLAKPHKRARLWSLRLALLALAIQVLMPLNMALAAKAANNSSSDNTLELCTQFGIQLKSINLGDPGGAPINPAAAKTPWDCPICQLQIGADIPDPQIFALKAGEFKKNKVGPAPSGPPINALLKGPNPPRAPPAV